MADEQWSPAVRTSSCRWGHSRVAGELGARQGALSCEVTTAHDLKTASIILCI
jgi:hypothetical protein